MSSAVAPTLNSRLASACNCAYGISVKDGTYEPPPIYDPGVGWTEPPLAISATQTGKPKGPRINACLVGRNQDGIVAAFRGTLPPAWTVASLEDWWDDIVDSTPIEAKPLPGKVHRGFYDALETIWDDVLAALRELLKPDAAFYVTGHSKGGPLASIAAARLALLDSTPIVAQEVVTFASPHPGDCAFVTGYPKKLSVARFENYLDIVPFLPPTDAFFNDFAPIRNTWIGKEFCRWFPGICKALDNAAKWNYAALGPESYVTSQGKVVGAQDPEANSMLRLGQILLTLFGLDGSDASLEGLAEASPTSLAETGLARIGAAHCIACRGPSCAGGYMTGAGGDAICPTES